MAGELSAKQTEYLNDIHESGSLLLSLINDILDLSKIEANKVELEYKKVPVKDLVERVLLLFKEKTMKHGIQLTAEYDDIIEDIEVDDRRIKQVLLNLVSNAVKFTNDGGAVFIRVRKMADDKGRGSITMIPGLWSFPCRTPARAYAQRISRRFFSPFISLSQRMRRSTRGPASALPCVRPW